MQGQPQTLCESASGQAAAEIATKRAKEQPELRYANVNARVGRVVRAWACCVLYEHACACVGATEGVRVSLSASRKSVSDCVVSTIGHFESSRR